MTKIEPVINLVKEDDTPSTAVASPEVVESVVPFTTAVENLSIMVNEINYRSFRDLISNNQSADLSRQINSHVFAPTASFKTPVDAFGAITHSKTNPQENNLKF